MTVGIDSFALIGIFSSLAFLLIIGTPIAFALATSGLIGCYLIGGWVEVQAIGFIAFEHLNSFSLLAIPLFILMGNILLTHKIGEDIYGSVYNWVGHLRGGLCIASTLTCAAFGFMCGSSPATAATVGAVALEEMEKKGYNRGLAAGSVAAAGTLASLIPPSIIMVIYCVLALKVSMGKVFLAGIIPGLLLTLIFIVIQWSLVFFFPSLAPLGEKASWSKRIKGIPILLPVIVLFFIIIGGIYYGFWSAIEAGAAGALCCIVLAIAYRRFSWRKLWEAAVSTTVTSVMIYTIIIGANILAKAFFLMGFHKGLETFILNFNFPGWVIIIIMGLCMTVLGMAFDVIALLVITVPIFLPIVIKIGYDPIWFGIMCVIFSEMALITPPVGVDLFVIKSVAPEGTKLSEIAYGAAPYVFGIWILLIIMLIFPQIVLWLPSTMK